MDVQRFGGDTLHMHLIRHEHITNNLKIKACQHFFSPKGTRQRRHGELRGSSESNELRFIHKARHQHQHGAKRSADTGAGGAGRKKESEGGREDEEKEREDRDGAGEEKGRGRMQQRSGGVDECVSPIVFTQFHPSNKSFKRGIREKVKAKQSKGETQRASRHAVQHCSKWFPTVIRHREEVMHVCRGVEVQKGI